MDKSTSTDFYDIYGYYYQPIWETKGFKITFIVLILLIISITTYLVVRRFIHKKKQLALLPWQWAFDKLNLLSQKNSTTKNDFKKFYFELTDIIKIYLNKRYDWKTSDKTDNELITYLEIQKFDKNLLLNLRKLMDGAVWIKFANEDAIKNQVDIDLKIAYEIVEKTKENITASSGKHAKSKN
jgi:hypothetical protein